MNKHHPAPNLSAAKIKGGVHTDTRHDSAHKHVTGQAVYIDDMPEPAGTLHGCLGLSTVAHGRITSIDLAAVRAAPGVVDVLTAKDVPGENDISPTGKHDEPVLADGRARRRAAPPGWRRSPMKSCRRSSMSRRWTLKPTSWSPHR